MEQKYDFCFWKKEHEKIKKICGDEFLLILYYGTGLIKAISSIDSGEKFSKMCRELEFCFLYWDLDNDWKDLSICDRYVPCLVKDYVERTDYPTIVYDFFSREIIKSLNISKNNQKMCKVPIHEDTRNYDQ